MALEIIDDRFGEYKKTLHDLILLVLAKEYPLKIGEICHKLKNEFNTGLTFQAVRKSLNLMVARKILTLEDKKYSINKNYTLEMKRLSDQILKNYFSGEKKDRNMAWENSKDPHAVYVFDNYIKIDSFVNEIILDWIYSLKENDDRVFVWQSPHFWYILGQSGSESSFCLELKTHRIQTYYIADENTTLDLWTKKFYDRYDIKYEAIGSSNKMRTSIGAFGDFVIQYDYPEELYDKIDAFYKDSKNLETTDIALIGELLKFKTEIKLMVMKNKAIAQKLKDDIKSKIIKS